MKPRSNKMLRTLSRLAYYGKGMTREWLPHAPFEWKRNRLFEALRDADLETLLQRANYYCKLEKREAVHQPQFFARRIDRSKSRYFIDLAQYMTYFDGNLRIDTLYGDVTEVPDRPTILKSRPVEGDNANSVLMNLDRLRHYALFHDPLSWREKKPLAVWRGVSNNPLRTALIDRHADSPFCDVGFTGARDNTAPGYKSPIPQTGQFAYRYILSIEGNDVATNLKWVMASNSICLMPKPRFETWFMEGQLKAGEHYVEVRDDFSDLEEKIGMLEQNPERAAEIIRNANHHVEQFFDPERERLVSLLTLQKYFEATQQLGESRFSSAFFQGA